MIQIMQNVLLQAEGDNLVITFSNLDQWIRLRVKAEIKEEGSITVPMLKLNDIIKNLSADSILIEESKYQVTIKCGGSTFRLIGLSADGYPPYPIDSEDTAKLIKCVDLIRIIRNTEPCKSADVIRMAINSVYVCVNGNKVTSVATDGRRLAVDSATTIGDADTLFSANIPSESIPLIMNNLQSGDTVMFSRTDKSARFRIELPSTSDTLVGNIQIITKLVEGNFPDYTRVMPDVSIYQHSITVERELLINQVRRVSLVADDKSRTVVFKISEGVLRISAVSNTYGSAIEEMVLEGNQTADLSIALNPDLLISMLKPLTSDKVTIFLNGELEPCVIRDGEYTSVLMPLRLS